VLSVAEWIDLRARRITPIHPGSLLAVERHRHRGDPVALGDGTVVHRGDRADIVHFDNRRLRALAGDGWQGRALEQARIDLGLLAGRITRLPSGERPVAFQGATLLAPYAVRIGWERHPRRPSAWHRIEDWYLRSLLARWAPEGRERLRHGHGPLSVDEVWISAPGLIDRFGGPRDQ
jgi:YkoP domain